MTESRTLLRDLTKKIVLKSTSGRTISRKKSSNDAGEPVILFLSPLDFRNMYVAEL